MVDPDRRFEKLDFVSREIEFFGKVLSLLLKPHPSDKEDVIAVKFYTTGLDRTFQTKRYPSAPITLVRGRF